MFVPFVEFSSLYVIVIIAGADFYLMIGLVNRQVHWIRLKILVGWSEAALMNSV